MEQTKMAVTARRMTTARALLVKENPFFGHLAMGLKLACAPCGTACTDGNRLIFDPDFAEKLSDREMEFVVLHEVLHCALDHCTRGKGLHSEIHNIACDIVVNSTILEMWGLDTFLVAGKEPMHRTPNGKEGRLFNTEEVYHMLLKNKKRNLNHQTVYSALDIHDLWQGIEDTEQLQNVWQVRVMKAAEACADISEMPPAVRKLAEELLQRSKVNWRQLLHDFIQYDIYDYTFLPPDRRFSDSDFFLPAYNEDAENGSANDIWVCVDTSGSVTDETLTLAMVEIQDAMRQAGLKGMISFFDHNITDPVPFSDEEELKRMTPMGGGGTSFSIIFRYLKEELYPELPKAILIFTDGYARCPAEDAAMEVPVLWLISKGGKKDMPWGQVVEIKY